MGDYNDPSLPWRTWSVDDVVRLRVEDEGISNEPPETMIQLFKKAVDKFPKHLALASKINGEWQKLNYQQYFNLVKKAAKSFIKLGLQRFEGVGIIGFNSVEWFISDLGAIFAGGLATGIYCTNSAKVCETICLAAKCRVVIVENQYQLDKILSIRHNLPMLDHVIIYSELINWDTEGVKPDHVMQWQEFIEIGTDITDETLNQRMDNQKPNQCCTLIFTSGTTGNPKGVMLSHDNMIFTAKSAGVTVDWPLGTMKMISYLPLSHVAAQVVDIVVPLVHGSAIYFAQPDALKGTLGETLKEVQPTSFVGVPRVWEKIQEKMTQVGKNNWFYKRWIATWARDIGLRGNMALMNGQELPYGWALADYLVFQPVRVALGLDKCRLCIVTAAPVMKDTLEFFMSLNINLLQIYGLSESSGPHTVSRPGFQKFMSVGQNLFGTKTCIQSTESSELCLMGRNIFMGYLSDEAETKLSLDESGWFHTGDTGEIDSEGYVYITGRLKELLITAGGENIAPVPIEEAIKEQLPCISNVMVIGDRRKYLSVLLTFKTKIDPVSLEPTHILAASVIDWLTQIGYAANGSHPKNSNLAITYVEELIELSTKEPVKSAIMNAIRRANQKAISRAQNVQKFLILDKDFTISGGELGPTTKLKRSSVAKIYKKEKSTDCDSALIPLLCVHG